MTFQDGGRAIVCGAIEKLCSNSVKFDLMLWQSPKLKRQNLFVIGMEVNQVLELYPDYSISVTLFSDVSNSTELRDMLIQGKLKAALVNATMVPDVLAVLLACNKAVHLSVCGKLKTRSVHSEVIFNLSPTSNITESLKTFGLSDEDPTVLVVTINKSGTNNMENVVPLIKGQQLALTKLDSIMDEQRIKKVVYKEKKYSFQ